ncbi:MAG: hypothetical protein SPL96_07285 [Bacteroidales bacterium]|nr:hypothetical protein [Bacteroidales bacterium]
MTQSQLTTTLTAALMASRGATCGRVHVRVPRLCRGIFIEKKSPPALARSHTRQ